MCLCLPLSGLQVPRVLLRDDFIAADAHPYSLLYRILSQDQRLGWQADDDEFFRWKTLHESGCLAEHTNSFLMLISSHAPSIKRIAPFDFVHFSSENRSLGYRTCTSKLRGEERVVKKRLCSKPQLHSGRGQKVRLTELESNYERGPLVTTLWLEACLAQDFETCFTKLLEDYYRFVLRQAGSCPDKSVLVDLIPSNLVAIGGQDQYMAIDQEWIYTVPFSTDFILFRAFLWFGYHNRFSLAHYRRDRCWATVRDFVEYCFTCLALTLNPRLDEYTMLEDNFHAEVAIKRGTFSSRVLLETPLNSDTPQ